MTAETALLDDRADAPPGLCGYVPSRQPEGDICGRPAEYVARLSVDSRPGGVCAEHAPYVRQMPELVELKSYR